MRENNSGVAQALTILRSMFAFRAQEERKGLPSMFRLGGNRPKEFGQSSVCEKLRRKNKMRRLGIAGSKI